MMISSYFCKMSVMKDRTKEISSTRIKRLLAANGWSQSDLAKMLSVSPQAVQQWVKGTSSPRGTSLTKLSKVTGLPEHWFFLAEDSDALPAEIPTPDQVLNEQQKRLLALFRKFPETEKEHLLAYIEDRLSYFDALREELIHLNKL